MNRAQTEVSERMQGADRQAVGGAEQGSRPLGTGEDLVSQPEAVLLARLGEAGGAGPKPGLCCSLAPAGLAEEAEAVIEGAPMKPMRRWPKSIRRRVASPKAAAPSMSTLACPPAPVRPCVTKGRPDSLR